MKSFTTTIRGSKYQLRTYCGTHMIMDSEADFVVGHVAPQYRVLNMHGEQIAKVASPEEAVKALEEWDATNPPKWERYGRDRHDKVTPFGVLKTERQSPGTPWLVFRDDGLMVSTSGPVRFRAAQQAMDAAEAHLRDGYPGATPPDDCRWWLDQDNSLEGARAERLMIATGNFEGELVRFELSYAASQEEERAARELAVTRILERAIGLAVADVISVMCRAGVLTILGLPPKIVADDLVHKMERLVGLAKLANFRGILFARTMVRNGKCVLQERCGTNLQDSEASLVVEEVAKWLVKWLDGDPQALRKLTSSASIWHGETPRP